MVEKLREPSRYLHAVTAVSVIETHISFVLLTGKIAYKIKKAVDLGFVDYTSPEKRRFYCEEELRLNRRLAPQLYLGMVPICGSWSDPRWEGSEAIDYAVKMTEFAQADLLDRILAQGRITPKHIDALAATVAAFHRTLPTASPAEVYGSPAAVWAPVETNFSHLRALAATADRPLLASLEIWSHGEYRRLQEVFAQRKADGFVRECHGDLHLGNIVLAEDEPVIFDCIEFNPALRWIDIVSDLAFLVMDLSERGQPNYAWRLINDWLESLGDYAGLDLLRFYQVYRALVRAKVAGIRSADETLLPADRQAAQAVSTRYLAHGAATTAPRPRALLITHGLAGSGKSTVARAAAERLGAVRLRSDVERKRLHGLPPLARSGSGLDTGLYAEAVTCATYERLIELATQVLVAGYPAIIDATCLGRWQRHSFQCLARKLDIPFLILDCRAPRETLQQRVTARAENGGDASEATLAVLDRQLLDAEPLSAEEQSMAVGVDTTGASLAEVLEQIRQQAFSSP
jgi:aminoglycoside phosphotransferase family enzyme/predicted kinase